MGDAPKNCKDCPSFLPPEEAASYFKKNIGSPMCSRYGYILGKPTAKPVQETRIQVHYAENCRDFGEPRPIDPPKIPMTRVAVGDPTVLASGPPAEADRARVTSCLECTHYVRPDIVSQELGWPSGLCRASGRIILPNRTTVEAQGCEWRYSGPNALTTDNVPLMPVYEEAFNLDANPVTVFLKKRKSGDKWWTDPADYKTDKPVEAQDAAAGIRAWRRIDDPEGTGFSTHLPIYDPSIFEENERVKIPVAGSDEHPELYVDHDGSVYEIAVAWRELDETPMVWGEPGTGKTERFRHLAWLMQLPFDRISLTAKSEVDDIIGKWLAEDTGSGQVTTVFQLGRLPKRWVTAGVVLLDEPTTAPDEIWQTIRPMIDNSKQLVLDQKNGEHLPRHADCYLGMASNPPWDVRNIGSNPMSDADGNRLFHLAATMPPAEVEKAILLDRCALDEYTPPDETLKAVMGIAKEIRAMCETDTLPISWGIRPQIKVIRATRFFGIAKAYALAVTNLLEPETGKVIMDIVDAHV